VPGRQVFGHRAVSHQFGEVVKGIDLFDKIILCSPGCRQGKQDREFTTAGSFQ
jgi:hypothetical protein